MKSHHSHPNSCNDNSEPLNGMESFSKQHDTQNNVKHWIDKVPKTRLDNIVVLHGPNENQPIDADQDGCNRTQREPFSIPSDGENVRPLATDADDQQERRQRPDDSMANDFKRIDGR